MQCLSCGYPIRAAGAPCSECGLRDVEVPPGRPATILGTALRILALRPWRKGAWIRSVAGSPRSPRSPWRASAWIIGALLALGALLVLGSRCTVEVSDESRAYRSETTFMSLDLMSYGTSISSTASRPAASGRAESEPRGRQVRFGSVGGRLGSAWNVQSPRLFAILATPFLTWLLLRHAIGRIVLRRGWASLDGSERQASVEALAALTAATVVAQALWILAGCAMVLAAMAMTPTWVLDDFFPLVASLRAAVWGCGLVGVPVLAWALAVRGDTPEGAIRGKWTALALVAATSVAAPILCAAGAWQVGNLLRLLAA